jgi:TM2 domain-containing membrane protein YozV
MSSVDGGGMDVPHHISDIDVWGGPDRSYYVFIVMSFILGFFGLDHFYLRSYDTGLKKLLVNCLGLGVWYFWDIIQILYDGKTIRRDGLNSPLDWIRGIGRGVFKPSPGAPGSEKEYAAPRSYIMYTIFAVFFGFLGLDYFYIGETGRGLAKLFSVFNIFLFLFGILWVLWDAFNVLFRTESILRDGIMPMPPYTFFLGSVPTAEMFRVKELTTEEKKRPWSIWDYVPKLWIPAVPWREIYRELVVPVIQPSVAPAVAHASHAVAVGDKAVALGSKVLDSIPGVMNSIEKQTSSLTSLVNATMAAPQTLLAQGQSALAATAGDTVGKALGEGGLKLGSMLSTATAAAATAAKPTGELANVIGSVSSAATAASAIHSAASDPGAGLLSAINGIAEGMANKRAAAQTGGSMDGGYVKNQSGGGEKISSAGAALAGTLTALVIAGGAKGLYDTIKHQYG